MRVSSEIHASSHRKLDWESIEWRKVEKKVKELQMRIAKAIREISRRTGSKSLWRKDQNHTDRGWL